MAEQSSTLQRMRKWGRVLQTDRESSTLAHELMTNPSITMVQAVAG
jgi:hypothetical protein